MPFIVSRFEIVGGSFQSTPIGYVNDRADLDTLNAANNYDLFRSWIVANDTDLQIGAKIVSEFFEVTPLAYGGDWYVSSNYMGLPLITDLNNPEGA
jgi:hypothetical protein